MTTVKSKYLRGLALDWAVGKCEHGDEVFLHLREPLRIVYKDGLPIPAIADPDGDQFAVYLEYSSYWDQGGEIIEREGICLIKHTNVAPMYKAPFWTATPSESNRSDDSVWCSGPTALVAAMRCFVCNTLGAEIEIPDEFANFVDNPELDPELA